MRAITIRFPDDLANDTRDESRSRGESINQFVVDAVAEAVIRRRASRALVRMSHRLDAMRTAKRVGTASEPLIRDLREGRQRRA
jgi:hypothetical protein